MTAEEYAQNVKPEKVTYNDMGTEFITYEYTEQQLIDAFDAGRTDANSEIQTLNEENEEQFKIIKEIYGGLQAVTNYIEDKFGFDNLNDDVIDQIVSFKNELDDIKSKYGWHDLIQNPEDLPKVEMNNVLLKLLANGKVSYTVGVYGNYDIYGGWKFDFHCPENLTYEVIAWKEIE